MPYSMRVKRHMFKQTAHTNHSTRTLTAVAISCSLPLLRGVLLGEVLLRGDVNRSLQPNNATLKVSV